ncbi:jg2732 [Pararge aegeria aegeria]|uniref:Jg2732 protein n=1 Tax=Pararge aegeria aegeria TaxID=348720 RepID=A0A8S4R8E4_9NEOP|nr:jg2732 [Pararge aegeria aegeria]
MNGDGRNTDTRNAPIQWSSRTTTLQEALGDLGGLLSFWSELGWLEWSSEEPHQWPYVQRSVPDKLSAENAQEQKKKKPT